MNEGTVYEVEWKAGNRTATRTLVFAGVECATRSSRWYPADPAEHYTHPTLIPVSAITNIREV